MLRIVTGLALLLTMWLAQSSAVFAESDEDTCYAGLFTQKEIDACTRVIGATEKTGKALAGIYYERALKYRLTKQGALALADINTTIKLDPDFKFAYTLRAHVYADLGDYARALEDHNKVISMEPNSAVALTGRGVEYTRQKKYDLAFADFNKALSIDPKYFYGYYYRGAAFVETRDFKKAVADYETAASINPDDQNAQERLRDARAKLRGGSKR